MTPTDRSPASASRPTAEPDALVELGRIVSRHGVRGELRLRPHNPASTLLLEPREVLLTRPDGSSEWRRALAGRRHKQVLLMRFDGVESAEAAQELIGCQVAVPRSALPPAGPAEVYHVDLIGCAVRTTEGALLGAVAELIVTGANDVLVVRGEGGEVLIPLVADVIDTLDAAARAIVVRPFPGLLDP